MNMLVKPDVSIIGVLALKGKRGNLWKNFFSVQFTIKIFIAISETINMSIQYENQLRDKSYSSCCSIQHT